MPSLGSILILALVFVTVGFIGGALVAIAWSNREKTEEKEEPPARKIPSRLEPILELFRLRTNQQLVVFIDEKYYTKSSEMEESLKSELRGLAEDWLRWLGVERPTQPVAPELQAPPAIDIARESEARLNGIVGISTEEPPSAAPQAGSAPVMAAELGQELRPRPTTIVGQINEILQEKLAGTNKTISLADDMHRGVIVWVGIEKFDGIDAVPYPDAQKLIREAVKEWEQRNESAT
ncbi:hypothetical protein ADN00_04810 [Ornatilinea apprima]|uniref:Uncharacterized protein n=1 Tax=Ornatilinea apprima TaxID=1134406 RepID=A0A0P6XG69_9CHLR|nr:hypothetical protein [Ornatilinea apprima]KPL79172.1 hypothetical protein ADN00_04810 [Ornatilinea apprima]